MAKLLDRLSARAALVEVAREFHRRGWMVGTSGNLSARPPRTPLPEAPFFWVSASGLPKGALEESDFLAVDLATGKVDTDAAGVPALRPSAETAIHRVIYQLFPETRACFHFHTVASCVASDAAEGRAMLPLPSLEMIKGLDVPEDRHPVTLPLFDNHPHVPDIAQDIATAFRHKAPAVPALLIRHHGVTVWGPTIQQTYNRAEIVEFICQYLAAYPSGPRR